MSYTNPKYLHEIIDLVVKAKTRKEKLEMLKLHDSILLLNLLKGTFDDGLQWNLPQGPVPYEPADARSFPSNLKSQLNTLQYFVKGGKGEALLPLKRETMFLRLIESIHPKDAELIVKMVNKQQPGKGITKKLVQEAFPTLISK